MTSLSSKSERVGEQGCSIKHGMTLKSNYNCDLRVLAQSNCNVMEKF